MSSRIKELYWLLSDQLGINFLRFLMFVKSLPWYFQSFREYKKLSNEKLSFKPCMHDRFQAGGSFKSEYFWQDLFVAQEIYASSPQKHVDIGSRVDGFVAHAASYRHIEIIDVRPVPINTTNISFIQFDFTQPLDKSLYNYCDSLSCLHALEHFGLGRYGDQINPTGYKQALQNMAFLLQKKGILYLSTPVGKPKVLFNANRIFDCDELISFSKSCNLSFESLRLINRNGDIEHFAPSDSRESIAKKSYSLALFTFFKL